MKLDLSDPKIAEALFTGDGSALEVAEQAAPVGPMSEGAKSPAPEPEKPIAPAGPTADEAIIEAIKDIDPELAEKAAAKMTAPEPEKAGAKKAVPEEFETPEIDLDAALSGIEEEPAERPRRRDIERALLDQVSRGNQIMERLAAERPAPPAQPQGIDWNAVANDRVVQDEFMRRAGLSLEDPDARWKVMDFATRQIEAQHRQAQHQQIQALQQQLLVLQQERQLAQIRAHADQRTAETLGRIAPVPDETKHAIAAQVANAMAYGYSFEEAFKAAVQPLIPLLQQLRTSTAKEPAKPRSPQRETNVRALRAVAPSGMTGGRHQVAVNTNPDRIEEIEARLFPA